MVTFEEWRAAKERLDKARKQLKILIVTFQKRMQELQTIEKTQAEQTGWWGVTFEESQATKKLLDEAIQNPPIPDVERGRDINYANWNLEKLETIEEAIGVAPEGGPPIKHPERRSIPTPCFPHSYFHKARSPCCGL
jgi:hypothetical protein